MQGCGRVCLFRSCRTGVRPGVHYWGQVRKSVDDAGNLGPRRATQSVRRCESVFPFLCLLENNDLLLPCFQGFTKEGLKTAWGVPLRTYSELFLLKAIRVFLSCAPVASKRDIAKANK